MLGKWCHLNLYAILCRILEKSQFLDHPFSLCRKFSKKLTFSFSENFVYVLNEGSLHACIMAKYLSILRQVGPLTIPSKTHCLCNHLTWFGSNFFIPPNKLDIKEEIWKFKHLEDYPALLVTFCVICGMYLLGLVWARRKDRTDVKKVR